MLALHPAAQFCIVAVLLEDGGQGVEEVAQVGGGLHGEGKLTVGVAASQCGHSDTVSQSRGSDFGAGLPSQAGVGAVGVILRLLVVALLLALIVALVIAILAMR